ncbi:response regulator [Janthinobacterium sp. PC23-8]|uniref:response regulator n=1 Tax=Janthinobacterium sp. PC23-8 TaxID=2012679 RepID=UPI000B9700FE|nr:response regulator [Janthinobacterium sp. PC23-8]OYO28827.1 hypothetical protein CD932_16915 [Janthinobacterium sp. PC23-8]
MAGMHTPAPVPEFLLRLDRTLRQLEDSGEILSVSAQLLGQQLQAQQVACFDIGQQLHYPTLRHAWNDGLAPGAVGEYFLGEYAAGLAAELEADHPVAVDDIRLDPRTATPDALATFGRLGIRAFLNIPIVKQGRLAALFVVHSRAARAWQADEITLAVQVAERVWASLLCAQAQAQVRSLNADMERQVAERTREFGLTWRVSPDLLGVLNLEGRFEHINPAWETTLGWTGHDIRTTPFMSLIHPDDQESTLAVWQALLQGQPALRFENRYRAKGGRWHWLQWVAVPENGKIYCSARDVSDEKAAAQALRAAQASLDHSVSALLQSQKLEALGKLTGGVAHDFNNVLQIISGNLQLLQITVGSDALAAKRIASSSAAVERGAKLSAQLLAFARRQPLKPLVTDLKALLRSTEDLLRRAVGETVDTQVQIASDAWQALVDPNQLENVILNLAINARDAMEGQGRLTVALFNCSVAGGEDLAAGEYVQLAIGDTGSGIAPELIDKIFEPFFTTKKEGEGSGLGLSMAYGFLKQSGGHLRVESTLGTGTTFRIYLPRSLDGVTELPLQLTGPVLGGTETILVVEDDPHVQTTVVDMLRGLGYSVLKASDGQGALNIVAGGVQVDLLFTDVVMPGPVASTELARQARQLLPGLAVLFTSGYTQDAIMHGGRLDAGVELLSKPYRREDLARRLRHLLANRQHVTLLQQELEQPSPAANARARGRNILLVEDNEDARAMTSELLDMLGHEVTAVGSAEAALPLLAMPGLEILLTDISLPRMSGTELAALAARDHPGLQVVFSTGHAPANSGVRDPAARFLLKPFSVEQLQQALQPD